MNIIWAELQRYHSFPIKIDIEIDILTLEDEIAWSTGRALTQSLGMLYNMDCLCNFGN